jgi:hypothetical protein
MSKPLNPYESPILPQETSPAPVPEAMIARFEMTPAALYRSGMVYTATQQFWLSASLLPLAGVIFLVFPLVWFVAGTVVGIIVAVLLCLPVLALYITLRRYYAGLNLARLRQHPLLGAPGAWQLTVGRERATLVTPQGERTWNLADLKFAALEGQDIVFWFEPDEPIAIPGDRKYARMNAMLRKWLLTEIRV